MTADDPYALRATGARSHFRSHFSPGWPDVLSARREKVAGASLDEGRASRSVLTRSSAASLWTYRIVVSILP